MSAALPVEGGLAPSGHEQARSGHEQARSGMADLLHCLGYVYLRHGQAKRAAVLLMVAGRAAPERPDLLRTLAAALVEAGMGDRAAGVLDRLAQLDPAGADHPMARLLRARALLLQGRTEQARRVFGGGMA